MVKMISKKAHRYGTRMMQAGEQYETTGDRDARLMEALGFATRAPKVEVVEKPAPKARKPRAVEPAPPAAPLVLEPVVEPFERTTPLEHSEVAEAPVAPKRPRLTLRRVVDSFGQKED